MALMKDMGQIMKDFYPRLMKIRHGTKCYRKHPLKQKAKIETFDFFLSWAEAWQKDLADILAARD